MSDTVLDAALPAPTLDQTIDTLRTLVDEAILHISDEGLRVTCVDPGNVAMHDLHLSASGFDIVPTGQYAIGVNLESIQSAIRKADSDQSVALSFDPENRMLRVEYGPYERNIASIDPDSIRQEPSVPDLELSNEFTVAASDWSDAIDMTNDVSDHVEIHGRPDDECVHIYAEGDTDDQTVEWDHDDLLDAQIKSDDESKFSLKYLDSITDGIPSPGEVTAVFGQEFPVELHYEFADGDGQVQTNLAPRIPGA